MASKEKGIRIAITGPECTGKTTLAQLLAIHFNGLWVPEFSRSYLPSLGRKYTYEDLVLMAKEQLNQEKKIWNEAKNKPVFSDTEMLVFYIWSMYRFDKCDQFIVQRIREADYQHYLLMYPDLTWEDDPLRENPDDRMRLFNIYEKALKDFKKPFSVIRGKGEKRLVAALEILAEWL